jgi:hypothetical protein
MSDQEFPAVAAAWPIPESIKSIPDAALQQRATEAWRAASQLRSLRDQWTKWFLELEQTGDADPGLAMRMAETVAVCVRALCDLHVDLLTFRLASPNDLLTRFPRAPWPSLEPPELKDPGWRREIEALLRRDDVLRDFEPRQQIREAIRAAGWIDNLECRKRVGELLQQVDCQSEASLLLHYIGETLQSFSWQKDPVYRRQTKELLRADGWNALQGELLGFLQKLQVAPSTAFISAPPSPPNNTSKKAKPRRDQPGRPLVGDRLAERRFFDDWKASRQPLNAFARARGISQAEAKKMTARERTRRNREPPKRRLRSPRTN